MWLERAELSEDETIAEFDQWVTPTLGSVRSSERFQEELASLQSVLEGIASVVLEEDVTHEQALTAELARQLNEPDAQLAKSRLTAVINSLFLVTAKTDNAIKCQYPVAFRRKWGNKYPRVVNKKIVNSPIPDVVKVPDIIRTVLRVRSINPKTANDLLIDYVNFLIDDETSYRQLIALVESYTFSDSLKSSSGRDLLAPLVAFQVRGSVAASGGHDPEELVRSYLKSWGLSADIHFNIRDVTATELNNWLVDNGESLNNYSLIATSDDKQRAFDFILPFRKVNSSRRLFVQSQFYAGDSGSVSHKNVDQASKARAHAADIFPDARFVELVDGAGYCASLRRDLRHLLFAEDTYDFVQLRSIPVRMRRILQESGIVSPLDIALLVNAGYADVLALEKNLIDHGIDQSDSWINLALDEGWITRKSSDVVEVAHSRIEIVDQYALLESLLDASHRIISPGDYLIISGYGKDFGVTAESKWESENLEKLLMQGVVTRREII